jgi:L-ascorbate metabolism protein UlaG (beta-lactamase superfamily)
MTCCLAMFSPRRTPGTRQPVSIRESQIAALRGPQQRARSRVVGATFRTMGSGEPVRLRWFGVAGIELQFRQHVLLVDPFLTRPPFRRLLLGRLEPNNALLARHIGQAESVLVTHAHWDHLLDVAPIVRSTGAVVVGSPNTREILVALGVSPGQVRVVDVGQRLSLGVFQVDVLPANHARTPLDWLINGPLPRDLRSPLRLRDYRMDRCFSFLIEVDELRLLDCPGPAVAADVLTIVTNVAEPALEHLLRLTRPRLVIPVHWDNLFRPLEEGLQPVLASPILRLPPFRRMDPRQFARVVTRLAPETRVLVPTAFEAYDLHALISDSSATHDSL